MRGVRYAAPGAAPHGLRTTAESAESLQAAEMAQCSQRAGAVLSGSWEHPAVAE